MTGKTQASKRKRKAIRKFRAFNFRRLCDKCSAKIPKRSMHHHLCQKCWNKNKVKRVKKC